MSRAQEGTVRNLQELYTVAVGVALVVSIEHLVAEHNEILWSRLPAFGAFLVTLVPFYHGAMRHLDQVYVEEGGRNVRTGALLADFFLLFIEACLFLVSAQLLGSVRATAWAIATLLALDAIWGTVVNLVFSTRRHRWAELRWVQINIVTAPALALFLILSPSDPVGGGINTTIAVVFLAMTVSRSAMDYWLSWDLYFPRL